MRSRIVQTADRDCRTITFNVADKFGNDRDAMGLFMGHGEQKKQAIRMFSDALDLFIENRFRPNGTERWAEAVWATKEQLREVDRVLELARLRNAHCP